MLQAGPVKTKKTKKGEQKAPRAKSAYLFFQADKRPALKGVRCGLHWALMHALYTLQTCMLGNAFGMHKKDSVPHYEAFCWSDGSTLTPCRGGAGAGHGRNLQEAGRDVEGGHGRGEGSVSGADLTVPQAHVLVPG